MPPIYKNKINTCHGLTTAQKSAVKSEIKEFIDLVIDEKINRIFGNDQCPFQFQIDYAGGQVSLFGINASEADEEFIEFLLSYLKSREEVKSIGIATLIKAALPNGEDKYLEERQHFKKVLNTGWEWKR